MTLIPASRTGFDSPFSIRTHFGVPSGPHPLMNEAWEALRKFVLYFHGQPVGTIVAVDHSSEKVLNYDQVKPFFTIYEDRPSFIFRY
jgi:hypothetical protein